MPAPPARDPPAAPRGAAPHNRPHATTPIPRRARRPAPPDAVPSRRRATSRPGTPRRGFNRAPAGMPIWHPSTSVTESPMSTPRGKYHIWTVGCQMNQADSQRIASILDGLGWDEVPTMDAANLVVLNTCSVREQPEKRAHGQLSLLRHAKRHRADLLVAMMGCMIGNQRTIDDLKRRYPVVDLFFKVENADILPKFLEERWTPIAGEGCVDFADLGAPRTIGVGQALPVLPMPSISLSSAPMQITPRPAARDLHYPTAEAVGMQSRGPTAWLPVVLGCNKV